MDEWSLARLVPAQFAETDRVMSRGAGRDGARRCKTVRACALASSSFPLRFHQVSLGFSVQSGGSAVVVDTDGGTLGQCERHRWRRCISPRSTPAVHPAGPRSPSDCDLEHRPLTRLCQFE